MKQKGALFYYVCCILFIFGCVTAGKNFTVYPLDSFIIGQTPKSQIVNTYGPPPYTGLNTLNKVDYEIMRYSYSKAVITGGVNAKAIAFEFKNGKLNGYSFVSDFDGEQRPFNPKSIESLSEGKTSKNDILDLLGTPNAKASVPTSLNFATAPSDSREIWGYNWGYSVNALETAKAKALTLFFNANDMLIDYVLK